MAGSVKRGTPLLLLALALALGCARAPNRAAVSGEVLVDHQPLVEGSITFFPVEGTQGPSTGAVIHDGYYRIDRDDGAAIGKNRVEIRGFRSTGRKVRDPMARAGNATIQERVPALAPEYNDKSTLVREVHDGDNTLDFDLPGAAQKK